MAQEHKELTKVMEGQNINYRKYEKTSCLLIECDLFAGKVLSWKTGGSLNNNVMVKNLRIFFILAPRIMFLTFSL